MKALFKTLLLALAFSITSCSSVRVASDYDKAADFNTLKSFAFYKTGIDEAEINDIDKKRILRSIEQVMTNKGFSKSESPDVLVSIFTKSRKQVNVSNNNFGPYGFGPYGFGWGWGWNPWLWGNNNNNFVSVSTEGVLYIDIIDAKKKELIWQGTGTGYLTSNINKKQERIQEFVAKVLEQYPPQNNIQ